MTVRVAMAQILVEGGRPAENLQRAEEAICQAAQQTCQLVVLPECLDLGWTDPSARDLAEPIPGPHSQQLAEAARRYQLYVIAGLVERAGPHRYNSAVLIDPDGRICLRHRKINELELAHDLYSVGNQLGVAHTPLGVFGVNICADNFPDSLAIGHVLARMGAQMILSPCAWAVDADHDNRRQPYGDLWRGAYRHLARLYDLSIVGVSHVGCLTSGPWQGRKVIGCSMAVGPDGTVLAEGPYGENAFALIPVDVELRSPIARGTDFSAALRRRGYDGP